jgi:hypothetical protein
VTRFENSVELWYQRRDLVLFQAISYKMAKQESVQGYLKGNATLFDHVFRNIPMDYRELPRVSAGLEEGYRGLERWSEVGKVRRLRVKAIVRKTVDAQDLDDMPEFAHALAKESQLWAELTGRLDALAAL